jgi:hypothetical protein
LLCKADSPLSPTLCSKVQMNAIGLIMLKVGVASPRNVRDARGTGRVRVGYSRPITSPVYRNEDSRVGSSRDYDIRIERIERNECRLWVSTEVGKATWAQVVLISKRTIVGHMCIE